MYENSSLVKLRDLSSLSDRTYIPSPFFAPSILNFSRCLLLTTSDKVTIPIVIKAYDKKLYATVDESIYALEKITKVQAKSENFDEIKETKERKIYIPKMIHPWKGKSFEEFIKEQKHRLQEDVA